MSFCKNCGASLNEEAKFCSNCGALVETEPVQEVAEPVQETFEQPVVPPVDAQPFVQQPAQPYYVAPQAPVYVQPMYQNPAESEKQPGLAMPIWSLILSSIAFVLCLIAADTYPFSDRDVFAAFALPFSIGATPFGIVGLVKSIKGRRVAGIVICAIALTLIFIAFFASIGFLE